MWIWIIFDEQKFVKLWEYFYCGERCILLKKVRYAILGWWFKNCKKVGNMLENNQVFKRLWSEMRIFVEFKISNFEGRI